MTKGIRAILFDFDGTLAHLNIDFGEMRSAVKRVGVRFGVEEPFLEKKYILEAIEEVVEGMNGTDREKAAAFRQAALQSILEVELAAAVESHLVPGVPELFAGLREHAIRTGIVTRNCRQAVDLITKGALAVDSLRTRDEVVRVKPHPEHLVIALQDLGVPPEEALMVGDHPMDVEAGLLANMRTVGVLTGNSPEERLRSAGATYVIPSVDDLMNLLKVEDLLSER